MNNLYELLCCRDWLFCLLARNMFYTAVIADASQLKQPVQLLSLFTAQPARLDEPLMDRGDDRAMLAVFQPLAQQQRCCGIERRVVGARSSEVVKPASYSWRDASIDCSAR